MAVSTVPVCDTKVYWIPASEREARVKSRAGESLTCPRSGDFCSHFNRILMFHRIATLPEVNKPAAQSQAIVSVSVSVTFKMLLTVGYSSLFWLTIEFTVKC